MKKTSLLATCFALLLAFSSPVLADGHYTSGDDMGVEGTGAGVVISKSATHRSTPSYSGKKVTSVPGGSFILASPNVENGWRKVTYVENRKTYDGWMLDDYMVHDQLILTLRKSNIPAYAAPTLEAKKVGSLSKYTQLNVISTWDDFYIVSLRDAAAFIPMDAAVWTSAELDEWLCFTKNGRTTCETTLRTGPGEDWPEAMTCKANTVVSISDIYEEENGWYFVWCDDKPAFVLGSDIQFN